MSGDNAMAEGDPGQATAILPAGAANPHAFVKLNADNTVSVVSQQFEMGQGAYTLAATLVAEELDAALEQIKVVPAGFDPQAYTNPLMGGQGTGGQTGTQGTYMKLRAAGAAMRAMLVSAAAAQWQVSLASVSVERGVVRSGEWRATFAELAEAAERQPVPAEPTLKEASAFRYIGKHVDRVDVQDKLRGRTVFTQDFRLPDMLTAVIARPTRPGAKLERFDATNCMHASGVRHVVAVPQGVAVVADNFWAAYEARERLSVQWDDSQAYRGSTADIYDGLSAKLGVAGDVALSIGSADAALGAASRTLSADYRVAYVGHLPFETLNIVVQEKDGMLDIWGGVQMHSSDVANLQYQLGIAPDKVRLHQLVAGGSFGKRGHVYALHIIEAVSVARALKTERPIKLMYSREDDLSAASARLRPGFMDRIDVGIDAADNVVAWRHRAAGQSVAMGTPFEPFMAPKGIDWFSVESGVDAPYDVPNRAYELHTVSLPIQTSWLRSTGSFHNLFAVESMVDELAHATRVDPLALRLRLLSDDKRQKQCLRLAAQGADYDAPLAEIVGARRGRGLACGAAHRSYGAVVAEVTVFADRSWRVDRLICAQDCGLVVNPDNVRSQIEGGAGFGLSMARYSAITHHDGEIEQHFYSDHHIVRMHTMPEVVAIVVASGEGPSGGSETITPLIAPAVANALFAAIGERVRTVPLRISGEPPEEHWDVPATVNTFKGAKHSGLR